MNDFFFLCYNQSRIRLTLSIPPLGVSSLATESSSKSQCLPPNNQSTAQDAL